MYVLPSRSFTAADFVMCCHAAALLRTCRRSVCNSVNKEMGEENEGHMKIKTRRHHGGHIRKRMSRGFRKVRNWNMVRGLGLKTRQQAMCSGQRKCAVVKCAYIHEKENTVSGVQCIAYSERDEKDGMKRNVNNLCAGNKGKCSVLL